MRYNIPLNKWEFSVGETGCKKSVTVPHTWNVDEEVMKHRGEAEYETAVFIDEKLSGKRASVSFNAVYHTAKVYINGKFAGCHGRSGFTPFEFDVTDKVIFGAENQIKVIADNTHIAEMLPHGDDFDWADDGGIIRKAELKFTEPDAVKYLRAQENIEKIENGLCSGTLKIFVGFSDAKPHDGTLKVTDFSSNETVIEKRFESIDGEITTDFDGLKLWSCYAPNLYRISLETDSDCLEIRTGFRKIEVRGEKILLNGSEIYLKGCEWMPGSHPDYGMAEPLEHSVKCLRQLKNSGCVFTRFHWQQDDGIFDWCDENGLLVQEEIPYWGYPKQATPLQLDIAKQQADEMVYYHANHPSIVFWGVGNELGAETRETINYVKDMVSYFKSLDLRRLVNYVSNTLSRVENIDRDDATLYGDIAMWNDYLGLWEPSEDIEGHMLRTCKKAQGKPLVVSEFGLCEPHFKGGDEKRAEILKERLKMYAEIPNIKGYVWFSLNDYRTHCGEEGEDKMRRRVHGSTDLYANEKPSYRLLCDLQSEGVKKDK